MYLAMLVLLFVSTEDLSTHSIPHILQIPLLPSLFPNIVSGNIRICEESETLYRETEDINECTAYAYNHFISLL